MENCYKIEFHSKKELEAQNTLGELIIKLNIEYANDVSVLNKVKIDPVLIEDYHYISNVDTTTQKIIVYGEESEEMKGAISNFPNSHKLMLLSDFLIIDGKVLKNRYGYKEITELNKTAIYPGSFDMFTNGHLSVLKKACNVFDEVIICISPNPSKKRRISIENCVKGIESAISFNGLKDVARVKVCESSNPAMIAQENNAKYIVRGIRDVTDFIYEESLAKYNKIVDESIETVYFRADDSEISSSMVYGLIKDGLDNIAEDYLPYSIDIIKE